MTAEAFVKSLYPKAGAYKVYAIIVDGIVLATGTSMTNAFNNAKKKLKEDEKTTTSNT